MYTSINLAINPSNIIIANHLFGIFAVQKCIIQIGKGSSANELKHKLTVTTHFNLILLIR